MVAGYIGHVGAAQIPYAILTLEFDILTVEGVDFQAHVLPVEFAVSLVVYEFLMGVGYHLECLVASVGIPASKPPRVDAALAPVAFEPESPFLVGDIG